MQEGGYVMFIQKESKPTSVPGMAKQVGEAQGRWLWVELSVWTERMLTALEKGVKGGVWFSLIDKVYSPKNLYSSYQRVKRNRGSAGVDHVTIKHYGKNLGKNLEHLHTELKEGTYKPQSIYRKMIPKPGTKEERPLGIPTVRDRVVQTALRNALEPIFEHGFAEHSYGFRPRRGCKDALRRVDTLLKDGYTYVIDADLKSYFDTIPHAKLLKMISKKIADERVINLLESFLTQKVLHEMNEWQPESGSPQGGVISPLLSNIYLDPLDHQMARDGYEMVRYADDLVILCRNANEAQQALNQLKKWVSEAGLTLHPTKTCIVDVMNKGFDFLGYHFIKRGRFVRHKSIKKLKDTIRAKTKRCRGESLEVIITDINETLIGWFEYFKHSHPYSFRPLDGWIRMRLRSILRKHNKKKHGAWCGYDNIRWPNKFFVNHGLFSLITAREVASQSVCR